MSGWGWGWGCGRGRCHYSHGAVAAHFTMCRGCFPRPLSRRRVKSAKLRVRRSSPDSIAATDTDALLDLDLDSPDNDAGSAAGVPAHDGRAAAAEARRDARIEQLHDDMRNLTMHVKAISNSLAAMQNEWD